MKILLIGKYPPMQGGISSKTYWLLKRLKTIGFEYKIITLNEPDYSTKDISSDSKDITIISKGDVPWHIPETSLIDDQITHAAMKTAKAFNPDLVETNYLWPFCKDALLISKLIKKPLLIRHAGSDVAKFHKTGNYIDIMGMYFNQTTAIVTNRSSKAIVTNICSNPEKIHCLQRYVPCPETFKPAVQTDMDNTGKPFDILFPGKINYHWRYKGLELLLKTIKRKNLKALFIIGGKYKNDIRKQIKAKQIETNIKIIDFVHPEKMPEIYRSCRFVWCWENPGGVNDFSNIIWEAIFSNTPCIVNNITKEKITAEGISKTFEALLLELDEASLFEFDFNSVTEKNLSEYKELIYEKYIDRNVALYKNLL